MVEWNTLFEFNVAEPCTTNLINQSIYDAWLNL